MGWERGHSITGPPHRDFRPFLEGEDMADAGGQERDLSDQGIFQDSQGSSGAGNIQNGLNLVHPKPIHLGPQEVSLIWEEEPT